MNKLRHMLQGGPNRMSPTSRMVTDSRKNSLDTTSSMNTMESDATWRTGGECSSSDFPDCPLVKNKYYTPILELYKQSVGIVYLAKRRDNGQKVVVKLVERGASVTKHVATELLFHRQCYGHPFVTQLVDVFLTERHIAIVLEHVTGGDILELVNIRGKLPENESRWLFQQLVVGSIYFHSLGADGRDIKLDNKLLAYDLPYSSVVSGLKFSPESAKRASVDGARPMVVSPVVERGESIPSINDLSRMATADSAGTSVLIAAATTSASSPAGGAATSLESLAETPQPATSAAAALEAAPLAVTRCDIIPGYVPIVKIQDFMYSKSEQINSDPHSALGSLPYTAPEVLTNNMREGSAADIWALGVALFKIATGLYPFERAEDGDEARTGVQAVLSRIANVDYTIPKGLSPGLTDLLSRMLVRSPTKRISIEEIAEHPWVTANAPPGLYNINDAVHTGNSNGAAWTTPSGQLMTEEALQDLIKAAQVSLRPLDAENVEDLADEILNEQEADDLLDELALGY